ncbi:hypothetical protein Tco_0685420 [Tanacetum coccineum]
MLRGTKGCAEDFNEFIVIRRTITYNVILGDRPEDTTMPITSTIHSMIKFPTPKGIATLIARTITIAECRKREEKQMIGEEGPRAMGMYGATENAPEGQMEVFDWDKPADHDWGSIERS